MAQIRQVVSEQLQATIRRLLPSQQGFTEDLQASNVITPIIDLTPSAEGDTLPVDLARAIAFGSQTAFNVRNATSVLVNNTGFYRIFGAATTDINSSTSTVTFSMSDGLSTKVIWGLEAAINGTSDSQTSNVFDFIVFLDSGDSLSCTASNGGCNAIGSTRQVADINGNIVNPSGFTSS